jgi:hypothetical protein
MTTEFEMASAARNATTTEFDRGATAAGDATPSPSTPTTSTPWGSTSTTSGRSAYGSEPGVSPTWSSTPLQQADAPTTAVPLVQDPIQAGGAGANPPSGAGAARAAAARNARARGPRRARLQLRHINPWTVLKFSCVLSIALFFVWLIVIGVLFGVLDGAGVIGKINDAYTTIQGGNAQPPVRASVVFGGAAIIGVVNIVLFIALTTVGSVVYNLCADLVGGIEITLSER